MDPNFLEENEIRYELALRGKPFDNIRHNWIFYAMISIYKLGCLKVLTPMRS